MEDATYVTHDNDHLHGSNITVDSWLADSATSSHICNNKNVFVQFTPLHTHVKGVGLLEVYLYLQRDEVPCT